MASTAGLAASAPSIVPTEISFLMPKSIFTNVHIHLTFLATTTMVFITTTAAGESTGTASPMGSFVYGMPDRNNVKDTLCTTLYSAPSTIDYATRVARVLARKMQMPVYVGCSANLAAATAEEEMGGMAKIIETVMRKWEAGRSQ